MNRTAALIAFFSTTALVNAAMMPNREVARPVPAIPHGLNWNLMLVPEPRSERRTLSEEEVRQILPPVIALSYIEEALTVGPKMPSDRSPVNPMTAILTGTLLLFAAYGLIPRVHSQFLRFKSIDLRRDLFS